MQGFWLPWADKDFCPLSSSVLGFSKFSTLPYAAVTSSGSDKCSLTNIVWGCKSSGICSVSVPGDAVPTAAMSERNIHLGFYCPDH